MVSNLMKGHFNHVQPTISRFSINNIYIYKRRDYKEKVPQSYSTEPTDNLDWLPHVTNKTTVKAFRYDYPSIL